MMTTTTQTNGVVARTVFPAGFSDALRAAFTWPDPQARIDHITDQMVSQGVCRPRHDTSRLGEWTTQRMAGAAYRRGDVA